MMDLCFTARTVTKQLIVNEIRWLTFQHNDSGQFTHAAILQLVKGIQRVLKQQYNPAGGSKSMLDLLNKNNKGPQANKTITAEDLLLASQSDAVDKSIKTGTIIVSKFTLQANAQHEANQQNIINQALIGAKEGVVDALSTLVGMDITDSVLRHTNVEYKYLDKYTLH